MDALKHLRIWRSLERIGADLRYAVRSLRAKPTFCAAAVFTLAIGVGSSTAVFSIVENELWKPLPFPEPDRLVTVYTGGTGPRPLNDIATADEVLAWRSLTDVFAGLGAFRPTGQRVLRGYGTPEPILVRPVTANFFTVLGRGAALGRVFGPGDEASGSAVLLTHACWSRLFAADPGIVGATVLIDDRPHVIVGVAAPERLEIVNEPDLYTVVDLPSAAASGSRTRDLYVVARLKPDAGITNAEAAVRTTFRSLARQSRSEYSGRTVRVRSLRDTLIGSNWRTLYFFLGAAVFVLLLSCANVANLLLARALARQGEFAIRAALGGGGGDLIQLLIAEGTVLAALGGAAGLLLAAWTVRLLPALAPPGLLDRRGAIVLDQRVVLFTVAVAALTAILFGLLPGLFAARRDVQPLLRSSVRTIGGGIPQQQRMRSALVLLEVMMALVLLFGAGLFLNSFIRLTHVPLGFEPDGRVTLQIAVVGDRYADRGQIVALADRLVERARAVPGIQSAAIATDVPLGGGSSARFVVVGRPLPGDALIGNVRSVGVAYRSTLGIRLLAGRDFRASDREGAPRVALINENLARHFFPDQNALGKQLELLPSYTGWMKPGPVEIVGIVANSKEVGLNEVDFDAICLPFLQQPAPAVQLIAHASVPLAGVIEPLRRAMSEADSNLPVYSARTMDDRVADAGRPDRFNLLMISVFACIALLMSAVGIYGAMSYNIEQRTREFGIRLALGAPPSGILAVALAQCTRLGLIGTALGIALAFALARMLGSAFYLVPRQHNGLLYGVSLLDPLTLVCASAVIVAAAELAGFVPARRATQIDPIVALKCE